MYILSYKFDMSLIKVIVYATPNNKEPFSDWLDDLDNKAKSIISSRLRRMIVGDFGDYKARGHGVSELRIAYGSGYRVYFGKRGNNPSHLVDWWR